MSQLRNAAIKVRRVMRELVDSYSCEWCETRTDHDAPKKPRHAKNCAYRALDAAIRAPAAKIDDAIGEKP